MKYYAHLVKVISESANLFDLDVPEYRVEGTTKVLCDGYRKVEKSFCHSATTTLVTKAMLGVFGCVPAFDSYFTTGFGSGMFGERSLGGILEFYDANREIIDDSRISTLAFDLGQDSTTFKYPVAKVIDMIFFIEGMNKVR